MAGPERPDPLIAGRYRLGRRLGRGGMAEVFDAFDERLERRVALKVLRPEVATEAPMRQRFEAEARAAARLSHPAVVSVYDSGEHGGRTFLIMERLPGETLADRIKPGPVDQVWLKQAAADVLSALAAAHAIGLIHRDIKPGNVLITEDDRVKVADFGIAKMLVGSSGDEDLTQVGMILGTPAYLAPERLAGDVATVGTDLYALAVVLYEAATGHKPPAGAADATVVGSSATRAGAGAVAGDPPLDPALARVIRRAMAPDPAHRYPSADAMAADLARGGGDPVPPTVALPRTVVAPAPTQVMAEPVRREVSREEIAAADPERRRGLAIAAALIALLIAVVIIVLLLTHHSSSGGPTTTTVATTPSTAASTTTSSSSTTSTTAASTTTTTQPTTTTTRATTTTTAPTTTTSSSTTSTSTTTTSTTSQVGSPANGSLPSAAAASPPAP